MAIVFDAASSTSNGGVTSLSLSHTATGSDRVVLFGVYHEATTVSALTYGGVQSASLIRDHSAADMSLYQLVAPATGAQTVQLNFAGTSSRCALLVVSYTGVDQTTPFATDVEATTATTTLTVNATSDTGQLVVDLAAYGENNITVDAGQTARIELDDFTGVNRSIGMSEKAGAATTSMTWTCSIAGDGFIIAVPLLPSSGGAGTPSFSIFNPRPNILVRL